MSRKINDNYTTNLVVFSIGQISIIDEIIKYKQLLDNGIINRIKDEKLMLNYE